MANFLTNNIDLNCSCGGEYQIVSREEDEAVYKEYAAKNETLYLCPSCKSIIGIKKTSGHPGFSNINIYNQAKEEIDSSSEEDENVDGIIADLEYEPGVSILSLKEREELNHSRINFDLSKNFLKVSNDNSKINFNISDGKLKCIEKDMKECLWTLPLKKKAVVSGLYYLDYQMALFVKQKKILKKSYSLIDSVLEADSPHKTSLKQNKDTSDIEIPIANLSLPKEKKEKVLTFSRDDNNEEFNFYNAIPKRHLKSKNIIPVHNYFSIIDPIVGQLYLEREGTLHAHSLGMDFLYIVYEDSSGRTILESSPTQESISTSEFKWKKVLNFKVNLITEHDDFLILRTTSPQSLLFNSSASFEKNKNKSDKNANVIESTRLIVEKKNGVIYHLKPVYSPS